jgi:phosphoribosyl 1,2-cyclic phosphate phosphodiesterase
MRLQLLGTAAAEGVPAIFCECDLCRKARERGGRDVRRRTAYAINADMLVDFGPDTFWQSVAFGVDLAAVRHIAVTHSHSDHLAPLELGWRRQGFSVSTSPLVIYGNTAVLDRVRSESGSSLEHLRIELQELRSGEWQDVGDRYGLLPLRAQHMADEEALNYVIREGGTSLIIANDTGWWPDETWSTLAGLGAGAAVIECTSAFRYPDQDTGHLGINGTLRMRDRMLESGVLAEDAIVVASHFSHNGGGLYDELTDFFVPRGIRVGFDGMVLEV